MLEVLALLLVRGSLVLEVLALEVLEVLVLEVLMALLEVLVLEVLVLELLALLVLVYQTRLLELFVYRSRPIPALFADVAMVADPSVLARIAL